MEERKESVFKRTKKGEKLFKKLHKLQKKYNRDNPREYGRAPQKVEKWIATISENDFYEMKMMPIGNYTRVHYTKMRKRKRKELGIE